MKKIFMAVIAIMMTVSASAQFYIYLSNGDVLQADSVSLIPPATKPVNGMLCGEFSVNDTTKVHFSQGNLQYVGTWQFAENQWDIFGNSQSDNHRDLFGWGPNTITNGGNEANAWRTLTSDEWNYLFCTRENAATLFGLGSVNGVNGTILLPDNWTLPAGASFTASTTQGLAWKSSYYMNSSGNNFSHNTYTAEQWAVMESAGAVFLPAAGYRDGTDVLLVGLYGYYWSATPYNTNNAYILLVFNSYSLNPLHYNDRDNGSSVRLVR